MSYGATRVPVLTHRIVLHSATLLCKHRYYYRRLVPCYTNPSTDLSYGATLRNLPQETAIPVQRVPGMWFFVCYFGLFATRLLVPCYNNPSTDLSYDPTLPGYVQVRIPAEAALPPTMVLQHSVWMKMITERRRRLVEQVTSPISYGTSPSATALLGHVPYLLRPR